jgi:ABC-2 type transport system permease protein
MKKILLIGLKDLTLAFRDRAALVLMLLAPFLLTVGLAFVTGRFSGGSSTGLSGIPVLIINQDAAALGNALVELFESPDLSELVSTTRVDDPIEAQQQVIDDQAAAVVIIPPGYTDSVIPQTGIAPSGEVVQITIIANPARPTSSGIVQTIVESFIGQVELGRIGGEVAIVGMIEGGLLAPDGEALEAAGQAIGEALAEGGGPDTAITLNKVSLGEEAVEFDILAYLAPGMALMFLMFTVTYGGRSFLVERTMGTLPRLLVTPTSTIQVLAGKVLGTYLTGVAQLAILIGASGLLFGVRWGDSLGVVALILAAVAGATGWGLILTAVAKTPGQINSLGTTMMLLFGILGGSFISLDNFPKGLLLVSRITPNSWGLDGFTTLALGGGVEDLLVPVAALLIMGAVLFGVAATLFNRQGMLQK